MRAPKIILAVLILIFSTTAALADSNFGIAAIGAAPVTEFEDRYNYGAGVAVFGEHQIIPLLDIAWQGSWLRFQRDKDNTIIGDDRQLDVFGLSAGPRLDLAFFHLGVDAGYYWDIDEWAVVPRLGFRIWLIDLSAEYAVTDNFDWVTARLGLVF